MILIEQSPNWILFKDKRDFYLSARVCCGLVDHSVVVKLTVEEAKAFHLEGYSYLNSLADKLSSKFGYPLRHGNFAVTDALVSDDIRRKIREALA